MMLTVDGKAWPTYIDLGNGQTFCTLCRESFLAGPVSQAMHEQDHPEQHGAEVHRGSL